MHLVQHDTAFAAVSRAPLKEISPFKKLMGWKSNGSPWCRKPDLERGWRGYGIDM
ncbi:MAG: DUF899 family protein [Candidatus Omnitrophica bacterium]|nr:DUF899 family protein [Candidatus Omnitrophota bacterium]